MWFFSRTTLPAETAGLLVSSQGQSEFQMVRKAVERIMVSEKCDHKMYRRPIIELVLLLDCDGIHCCLNSIPGPIGFFLWNISV